ncbi:MAG: ATP-binding protein [Halosimplex sp.]
MTGSVPRSSTYVRPLTESDEETTVLCLHPEAATGDAFVEGLEAAEDALTAETATTIPAAFECLETGDVDCLVCALSLPGSDGVTVLERVRAEFDRLPVVLVAREGSERVAAEAVNAGADGYVVYDGRPGTGTVETLVDRIETVVRDHRSRRRLSETTDRLFRLTEYANDALWMFTADWSETVVINDAYEDVWGRSQADLVDDPSDFLAGVHPDDREAVRGEMVEVSGGERADMEFRLRTDDDRERWVSVHAEPVFDDGEVAYVAGFTRDVSERRERERREREANERLETIVGNLPVVVFTLDPSGVFRHSSGKGLEILGLEPGDLEGQSVYDAYGDQSDIVDAVDRALDGEEVRATQDLSDLVFETWYRPVFDDEGDLDVVVGVARDVTELNEREARMERVTRAAQELPHARTEREVATVVVDIVDTVIDCPVNAYWTSDEAADALEPTVASDAALAAAGVESPGELPVIGPGNAEMERFRRDEVSVASDYPSLDEPSAPETALQTVMFVPLGDHGLLNVGDHGAATFAEFDRNLIEIIRQAAVDALDRVERERELERHQRELERSNESLQQFAYVASHDLQEPLRMVSSYVSLLDDEYGHLFDDEAEEYMGYAVDGARRMQEMIDALLQYSRVHTRGEEFVAVDTDAVFAETMQGLELLVEEQSARVAADDLPPVEADRSQLGQLFQNLVKNAVQHAGPEPTVEVAGVREGETVHFTVADDGPGIAEAQQERVFEIFKQNSGRTDSTGIGLAMCKRIVQRHDGEIWVESAADDGATFHFTMPAVGDDTATGDAARTATADGGRP